MNPDLTGMLNAPSLPAGNVPMGAMTTSTACPPAYNQQVSSTAQMTAPHQNLPAQLPMDSAMANSGAATQANVIPNQQPVQQQPAKEYNTAYLCRIGQETVQEIVVKTLELFQLLKNMTPPNGTAQTIPGQEEKKVKVREVLKTLELHFKRLRKMYERCNECCAGMEYIQMETLIPMKSDDGKVDDKKVTSSASKQLDKEHEELVELLQLKNRQIKEIIDNLRSIIWEINTMLVMRKP